MFWSKAPGPARDLKWPSWDVKLGRLSPALYCTRTGGQGERAAGHWACLESRAACSEGRGGDTET